VIVNVSPTAEKLLAEMAVRTGRPLPDLAASLLEEKLRELPLPNTDDDDTDPDVLQKAIAKLLNRTPAEVEAARARLFKASRPPRPLPEGKTLEDILVGQWPGDETDEQVYEALRKLS
jgi:hypothetical protein